MNPSTLRTLWVVALLAFCLAGYSQNGGVSISSTNATPDPSAGLDVNFTDKGLLPPRMTTAQRNAIESPSAGLLIFNTTTQCFNLYSGFSWQQMCGNCGFTDPAVMSNSPVCAGNTINLQADYIEGVTYSWTGPNGFTSDEIAPLIYDATTAASGNYSVTASRDGCITNPRSVEVYVGETPATPVITGEDTQCVGYDLSLSVVEVPMETYLWNGPNGFSATGASITRENLTQADAGTYSVIAQLGSCSSASSTIEVTVNDVASALFSPFVGGTNTPITFTPFANGLSYNWTFTGGSPSSSTSENPSVIWTAPGVYNVSLTTTVPGGCTNTETIPFTVLSNANTVEFNYTGGQQTWTVPSGVTSIHIETWGAQGGTYNTNYGGYGGYAGGNLSVTPGQTLYVYVGQSPSSYEGGFNGGGDGVGSYPTGGGGGTDVRIGGNGYSDRIIVGGGGGGAGTGYWTVYGGAGGGIEGGFGFSDNGSFRNGYGGTQTGGGPQQTGYPGSGSTDGTFGQGGRGSYNNGMSCGGGGGWYGGGGGEAGAGGGGSGYIGGVTDGFMIPGIHTGHGKVAISYSN